MMSAKAPQAAGLRELVVVPLVFALSLGTSAWSFSRNFEGGLSHEFCNYAEIGRNIVKGRGMRTGMLYPYALALLDQRGIPFDGLAPVVDRFPLHAWLTAAAEWALGADDRAIAALSALLLALAAAATSAAGLALFGPWEAAIGGALFALDPAFQRGFVLWGLPDFGFCALVLGSTVAASVAEGPLGWAAAGALGGAAWLQRPNFLLWLPLLGLKAVRSDRGGRRLGAFLAAFVAAAVPGAIYNLRWFGSLSVPTASWNLAHHTVVDTEPWLHYRLFPVSETLLGHLPALARKFARYLSLHARQLPTWWQMHLIFPASLVGGWLAARDPGPARAWTRLLAAFAAAHVLVFSLLRFETLGPWVGGRYMLWAAPAAFLLAAHASAVIGERLGRPRLLPAAFAAANLVFFARWLLAPQGPAAYPGRLPPSRWPEIEALSALPADAIVATNLPGQTVWYAQRPAIALPAEPDDLLRIDRRHPVSAVLVSRLRVGELKNTPAWAPVIDDPAALDRYAAAGGWTLARDFGTSILLRKSLPARL